MYFASHIDGRKIFMGPEERYANSVQPGLRTFVWPSMSALKIRRPGITRAQECGPDLPVAGAVQSRKCPPETSCRMR